MRPTNAERERQAHARGEFLVYQRHYRPSEHQYGNTLTFYKGFKTREEAMKCVMSNPQKYFM